MRQGTGSVSKTSPSSPTMLFYPTANCLSPTMSSSQRLKRRPKLISSPSLQQPLQHHPSIHMPCPLSPGVTSVATLTPLTSALLKGKNATTVHTILPCVECKDPSNHPMMPEAQSAQVDHPEIPGQGASKMTGRSCQSPGRFHQCPTSCSSSHSPSHSLHLPVKQVP